MRFRARSLCGVGARADVVCSLMARRAKWARSSELAPTGYTDRQAKRLLADLGFSGLTQTHLVGKANLYRLREPEALESLLGANQLVFPSWGSIFFLIEVLIGLEGLGANPGTQRVEANNTRDRIAGLAERLGLEPMPETRGRSNAYSLVIEWGRRQVRELALGVSPALCALPLRAAIVSDSEAWVWVHEAALEPSAVISILERSRLPGVHCEKSVPLPGGWVAFQIHFDPPRSRASAIGAIEHLLHPRKVSWESKPII
ncbi:MAG: hypothetical protein HN348_09820 [Proteobacteria bacterium]|nr:hypothetical protein [Pseudomonadota bacterium]